MPLGAALTAVCLGLAAPALAQEAVLVAWAGPDDILEFPPGSVEARPSLDANGGAAVTLHLGAAEAKAFYEMTARHVGDIIELRLCGETVTSPRVMQPIAGGSVLIAGNYTVAEVDDIARRITSGSCSGEAPAEDGQVGERPKPARRGG